MELAIETSSSTASPFTSVSFFAGGFLPQHLKIGISPSSRQLCGSLKPAGKLSLAYLSLAVMICLSVLRGLGSYLREVAPLAC